MYWNLTLRFLIFHSSRSQRFCFETSKPALYWPAGLSFTWRPSAKTTGPLSWRSGVKNSSKIRLILHGEAWIFRHHSLIHFFVQSRVFRSTGATDHRSGAPRMAVSRPILRHTLHAKRRDPLPIHGATSDSRPDRFHRGLAA